MNSTSLPQPHAEPGSASAEEGLVVLDGPNGVAVTMTPDAAARTGQSLISAAALAAEQAFGRSHEDRI